MPSVLHFVRVKYRVLALCMGMWPWLAWSDSAIEPPPGQSQTQFQLQAYIQPNSQVEPSYSNQIQNQLLDHYSSWEGTRHKLGGTTTSGVDCSSFIQTLFKDKFQLELPRSSREQMTLGQQVNLDELQSGDLLFFRTGPTRRHVGVYLGNKKFLHVSARAGVQIAKLFNPYWQRHFIAARRIALDTLTPLN